MNLACGALFCVDLGGKPPCKKKKALAWQLAARFDFSPLSCCVGPPFLLLHRWWDVVPAI